MLKYHDINALYVKTVVLVVSDLNQSIKFYMDILGLTLITKDGTTAQLGAHPNDVLLILDEIKGAKLASHNLGLYHVAFLLVSRASFAQLLKHLMDKKYPLTGLSDHGISEAIYLQDPDNNGIEIAVDKLDEQGNVYKLDSVGPKRINIENLFHYLPKEPFTKLPENTIIGHIHLHVASIKEAIRFFVEGFGLDIQLNYHNQAVFVSSKEYHHHIGFNIWQGHGASLRHEKQAGLKKYIMHVPTEKFRAIQERLTHLGFPITAINDHLELYDINDVKVILEHH